MKGSPEVVRELCQEHCSWSVPHNFESVLKQYTQNGYRVLGLACKVFSVEEGANIGEVKREEVENGVRFLGFLVMQNKLKKETRPVIE